MKVVSISISLLLPAATTTAKVLPSSIPATSHLGRSLLSQSRLLEQNNNNNNEPDYTWIANYSLKFQGCRHHTSFNSDADGDNDVRLETVHLAHFRLCPSNTCEAWLGGGCNSNYGEYVVDLETFAKTYVEGQRRKRDWECETYMWENCDCQETDDKGDDFNREYCEYDCYHGSRKYQDCIDRNPYEEEEEGGQRNERFEPQRYVECKEWEFNLDDDDDGNNNNNNNNNNNGNGNDDDQVQYYVGPYCSNEGGSVYLGLFTDDTCTNFADSNHGHSTFKSLAGTALPYSTTSLISSDCVSCMEQEDPNRQNDEANNGNGQDDDAVDEDQVSDQCERLYESAGKCEAHVSTSVLTSTTSYNTPNNAACSYIGGIKFTRMNGTVETRTTSSELATIGIILLSAVFAALAVLAFRLRKKLDGIKKEALLDGEGSENGSDGELS